MHEELVGAMTRLELIDLREFLLTLRGNSFTVRQRRASGRLQTARPRFLAGVLCGAYMPFRGLVGNDSQQARRGTKRHPTLLAGPAPSMGGPSCG